MIRTHQLPCSNYATVAVKFRIAVSALLDERSTRTFVPLGAVTGGPTVTRKTFGATVSQVTVHSYPSRRQQKHAAETRDLAVVAKNCKQ